MDSKQLIKEVKELQKIELKMLIDIDQFCKEHNIQYFLGEGTLLGAIRHNGFIPWDDDVDIIMPRGDYNKFLELAPELLKPKYEVQHSTTVENYWSPFIKIRLLAKDQKFRQGHIAHLTTHNGVLIDIFPLEYVLNPGSFRLKFQLFKIHFFRRMLFIKLGLEKVNSYKGKILRFTGKFYSVKRIHKVLDKEFNRYNNKKRQYIGNLASYHKLDNIVVPAYVYGESIEHEFEGHMFPVPKEYDLLLKVIYGDYMQLPPENERCIKHHFTMEESKTSMTNDNSVIMEQDGKVILPDGLMLNMSREDYICMQIFQRYVMEVLLVVDQFCRSNNLTYYLGEGTLLGAVRHGGFIPWDDDADIFMPREDYNRFLQLAKDGLPEGYALDSMDTNPKHWTIAAKVQMTRKVPYSNKRTEGLALHTGPCVDVFPLDYIPSDRSEDVKKRGKKVRILRRTMWIKSGFHKRQWYKTLYRMIKYYYPLKLYGMFRRSLRSIFDQIQRIMTETNDPSLEYLCSFGSLYPADRESFPKEYFGAPKYMEFEGHMLPVPSESDKILRRVYGDYMQYPSVQMRKSKHVITFEKDAIKEFEDDEVFRMLFKSLRNEGAADSEKTGNTQSS